MERLLNFWKTYIRVVEEVGERWGGEDDGNWEPGGI